MQTTPAVEQSKIVRVRGISQVGKEKVYGEVYGGKSSL